MSTQDVKIRRLRESIQNLEKAVDKIDKEGSFNFYQETLSKELHRSLAKHRARLVALTGSFT